MKKDVNIMKIILNSPSINYLGSFGSINPLFWLSELFR